MKIHKVKFILGLFLSAVLILTLFYGFGKWNNAETESTSDESVFFADSSVTQPPLEEPEISGSSKEDKQDASSSSYTVDDTAANSTPPEEPAQTEPESALSQENAEVWPTPSCTLSVRCDTILENIDRLKPEKQGIIPENGIIFAEQRIEFAEGASVFDLLLRIMRENNIHLEFVKATIYNSAYIEGIANIYEKDCGSYSGWVYKVNGKISNVGCSSYFPKDGDCIEWVYTCNLGKDL